MSDAPSSYPLTWPFGWPRTASGARRAPAFRSVVKGKYADGSRMIRSDEIRLTDARERLANELEKLRASNIVLSTNVELRADGQPKASGAAPGDPGAAVYFKLRGRDMVLACDRWNTVAGNMAALAAHIDALRGQDRWGVGSIEQAFDGYQALPAPESWRAVLGLRAGDGMAEARAAWIAGLKECQNTGERAVRLNAAMERAREALG